VAEREHVKIEIAFRSGQALGLTVSEQVLEELERALQKGEPDAVSFDADDGHYTVVTKMITFVKRHVRESRVGFGAAG
jgi:hypothetical protein